MAGSPSMKMRYPDRPPPPEAAGMFVRVARLFILAGVWCLVGLAGLAVWAKLTA